MPASRCRCCEHDLVTVVTGLAVKLPGDKAEEIAADLRSMGNNVQPTALDIS
jgi:hypothetical protein